MGEVLLPASYEKLAAQEAEFWGKVRPRKENPQLWDDPFLYELFLKPQWDLLVQSVCAAGHDVLELGCGDGYLSLALAGHGLRVEALDISEERIERARERSLKLTVQSHLPPQFNVADLNRASLPKGQFDVVVAHDSLHHILMLDRLLDEASGALRPGGSLVVFDFVGMGRWRRIIAAILYALLPTWQPYSMKLGLARRLKRFFQTETQKRSSLGQLPGDAESPFEEISQGSIVQLIRKKFDVIEYSTIHPFFYYLAPKIRVPLKFRNSVARWMMRMDQRLISMRCDLGAYVFIIARKRV
jgi:2-polyprenyl-3-methyl-5-hydroxy-6-metoxy-1,4-benzoquinol methylase